MNNYAVIIVFAVMAVLFLSGCVSDCPDCICGEPVIAETENYSVELSTDKITLNKRKLLDVHPQDGFPIYLEYQEFYFHLKNLEQLENGIFVCFDFPIFPIHSVESRVGTQEGVNILIPNYETCYFIDSDTLGSEANLPIDVYGFQEKNGTKVNISIKIFDVVGFTEKWQSPIVINKSDEAWDCFDETHEKSCLEVGLPDIEIIDAIEVTIPMRS